MQRSLAMLFKEEELSRTFIFHLFFFFWSVSTRYQHHLSSEYQEVKDSQHGKPQKGSITLELHKRDHKLLTWLLSSASPHSPRAISFNLVDLMMFRMYSQIHFQLSFYLNLLRILISSSLLVLALSHPKYHFPFLIRSHNSHSLPLLINPLVSLRD